jgi:hypothetical protein
MTWLALRPNWHVGFAKADLIRGSGFPFGMRPLDPRNLIPLSWHLIVLKTGFPEESPNAKGMTFVIRHVSIAWSLSLHLSSLKTLSELR